MTKSLHSISLASIDWTSRHAIIGGGIIGLSIGWQLARRGEKVTIIDRGKVGQGASWVAAGMLAPYAEIGFEEVEFFRMCNESLELYPKFLSELAKDLNEASDKSVVPALDNCGTLLVAMTPDDEAYLNRFHEFQLRIGLPSSRLRASEAREREPLLSPRVRSALWLSADKQINNRALLTSLRRAFMSCGGDILEQTEANVAQLTDAKSVIVAAGSHANDVSDDLRTTNPIRPVKGQIITLLASEPIRLQHMVRSPRGYVLQKDDYRILLGATSEEQGFDNRVTAGATMDLLRNAYELLPITYEFSISETNVGFRPATRSHLPEIGYSGNGNVYHAIGHYRHGILLTPYTAYRMVKMISNLHTTSSWTKKETVEIA